MFRRRFGLLMRGIWSRIAAQFQNHPDRERQLPIRTALRHFPGPRQGIVGNSASQAPNCRQIWTLSQHGETKCLSTEHRSIAEACSPRFSNSTLLLTMSLNSLLVVICCSQTNSNLALTQVFLAHGHSLALVIQLHMLRRKLLPKLLIRRPRLPQIHRHMNPLRTHIPQESRPAIPSIPPEQLHPLPLRPICLLKQFFTSRLDFEFP